MAEHFRGSEGTGPMEPSAIEDRAPTGAVPSATVPASPRPGQSPDGRPEVREVLYQSYEQLEMGAAPAPVPTQSVVAPPSPQTTGVSPRVTGVSPQVTGVSPRVTGVSPALTQTHAPVTQAPIPGAGTQVQPAVPTVPRQAPVTPAQQDLGYEPHGLYASLGEETSQPRVNRNLEPTISMRHVTKVYPAQPNKPALEDVTLDIYPGEFVFIVGHSGSGKSTFLRLLTRELRVTSGDIVIAGQSLAKMRKWKVPFLRRQIGCVFQDFKLLQDRTAYENVAFSLECIGKPKSVIRAQVSEVLRLVGLADKMDMFPDQLSGGEQQRVSVARAMVNRPPLLICDEPTGNLDPAISLGIMKLLDAINKNGTTVIMATHDREMVDSMRKRVVALENGHLVRDQERGGYGFYGTF